MSGPALKDAIDSSYESGYTKDLYAYSDFYYGPSIDGLPMLTDHTSFEAVGFSSFGTKTLEDTDSKLHTLWPSAGLASYRRLDQLYSTSSFTGDYLKIPCFNSIIISFLASSLNVTGLSTNSVFWRAQAIYGDFIINYPTHNLATAFSNTGLRVYKMLLTDGIQNHVASAAYLNSPPNQTTDPTLPAMMQDYWISFVKTLDPNGNLGIQRPTWPRLLGDGRNETGFSVVGVEDGEVGVKTDEDANVRCDFLLGRSAEVIN
ncbi:hypothetical protein E4T42_08798 [Aureobasidium subglaciale]|nr:hypothetical protein E4T42_08798 [Aureobasidium subglaciale]